MLVANVMVLVLVLAILVQVNKFFKVKLLSIFYSFAITGCPGCNCGGLVQLTKLYRKRRSAGPQVENGQFEDWCNLYCRGSSAGMCNVFCISSE